MLTLVDISATQYIDVFNFTNVSHFLNVNLKFWPYPTNVPLSCIIHKVKAFPGVSMWCYYWCYKNSVSNMATANSLASVQRERKTTVRILILSLKSCS